MKTLIGILVLAVNLSLPLAIANAEDNPFAEGTGTVQLSDTERTELLQYANNSRAKLLQALTDAKPMSLEGADALYLKVIKEVVIESFQSKPRTELLMRWALNQGLELTYGIPNANGTAGQKAGILQGSVNRDLLTVILEDSINLAIKYYESDREAIEQGTLLKLPYAEYAQQRLNLVLDKWLPGVFEAKRQLAFAHTSLSQWLSAVANEEHTKKAVYASQILLADQVVKEGGSIWKLRKTLTDIRNQMK
jgi:hypothetical protein